MTNNTSSVFVVVGAFARLASVLGNVVGKQMVTVRIGNAAHVTNQEKWHKVYGTNHQEKWKTKVDWNRFIPKKQYKLEE